MKLSNLKINPNNPQTFDDLSKLENSIREFPKMLTIRPLAYDPITMQVLGGNKRLVCLQNMGFKEIPDSWVRSLDDFTEEEKKRFVIADNVGFGEWDNEILNDTFDFQDLENWGLNIDIDIEDLEKNTNIKKESFEDEFNKIDDSNCELPIVPEFMENYNCFIIIAKNDIDEVYVRNMLGLEQVKKSNTGLSDRLSNVITVDDLKRIHDK